MPSNRLARQHAIQRQIERLDRRVIPLQSASNRVSWVRVIVFFAGIAGAVGTATQVTAIIGVGVFIAASILFTLVVGYHRHLERWIATYRIWKDLKLDQLARMNLRWAEFSKHAPLHVAKPLALDLDLTGPHSLHQLIDTTISHQGRQLLADWLTQENPVIDQVHSHQNLVRELVPLSRFRNRFRLTFHLVLREPLEGDNLLSWLAIDFHSGRLKGMLIVATVWVALNIALFAANMLRLLPPYWAISLLGYFAFFLFNQSTLGTVFSAVSRLDAELGKFNAILKYLEGFSYTGHTNLAQLCAPFLDPKHRPSAHVRRIQVATVGIGLRSNWVLGTVLNVISPWDFFFAFLADHYRAQATRLFPEWAHVCYELDALIALANFADLNREYTFPEITPDAHPIFQAKELGHPLIPYDQTVRNDFVVDTLGQVAIITGSNMAGKSTFIKTVGINLCLAYAGAPVNATHFRAAPFRLYTCIHITDSIVDGFSYFYAEVKCLKRLLDELKSGSRQPLLYLIDEIFRGTNNRERLLGSRAYIRAVLGENGVGLLATHDLELASLAEQNPNVHNYHFRDRVADSKLVFDYQIRPGPCPTTNALKIMQMEGLPINGDSTS